MEKTMITRVVPLPSSGSGDARIVRLGASRIVSRRNFLLQGGGALAALSLGSTGCSDNGTGPSDIGDGRNGPDVEEQSVDVIVVGAGLSGLVAAYELVRAGYNVRVLEARNEAGGRARTLREPFDDGLIAETGPARIPPNHDRTLGYIDRFDGFFPGSSEVAEHGTYFAWEHQPWIGAAFAPYDPPFEEHPELASPEGRIHFAGEHASGERGWMQGALQSGLRAASEIDPEVTGESSGAALAISPRRVARRFAAGPGVPGWLAV